MNTVAIGLCARTASRTPTASGVVVGAGDEERVERQLRLGRVALKVIGDSVERVGLLDGHRRYLRDSERLTDLGNLGPECKLLGRVGEALETPGFPIVASQPFGAGDSLAVAAAELPLWITGHGQTRLQEQRRRG